MFSSQLSAQQARLLKGMRRLKPAASELDLRVWLNNHIREQQDQEFSRLQEESWAPYMPGSPDHRAQKGKQFKMAGVGGTGEAVRMHSLPVFPGEYRANPTDVQSISVQNLKSMYAGMARTSEMFGGQNDLLLSIPTLDYEKLEQIVSNLFPSMERAETDALLRKVVEAIQLNDKPEAAKAADKKYNMMTTEMLQLQGYPQTFTAMIEAVARRQDSKLYKVTEAREQFFSELNFKWQHLEQLRKNAHLTGEKYTNSVSDVVDVVYDLYKDYIKWLEDNRTGTAEEEEHRKIPIRERQVVDEKLQYAYGTGYRSSAEAIARIRENADGNGKMSINGSVPISAFRGHVHAVERLLQPFDEADLNVFDFDVDVEVFTGGVLSQGSAARMAISNALVNLLPHTRVHLHNASFIYADQKVRPPKMTGERAPNVRYHWVKRGNPLKQFHTI